jgi:uncharacterized protein (TIGR02594 family)
MIDWMPHAKSLIGIREVPGSGNNLTIMGWGKKLGAKILGIPYTADSLPWCGLYVAYVMDYCGFVPPPIAVRASEWGKWGRKLLNPRPGCILVFTRKGGGHVGFYVGEDATHLHVLGGNQGDAVSITRIPKDRLSEMRWPEGFPLPKPQIVLLDAKGAPVTKGEA